MRKEKIDLIQQLKAGRYIGNNFDTQNTSDKRSKECHREIADFKLPYFLVGVIKKYNLTEFPTAPLGHVKLEKENNEY